MKKVLFLLLATVMLLTQAMAQQDSVSIGSGTTTTTSGPIPGLWGNHRSVQLFTASEMNMPMGGIIESLSMEIGSVTAGSGRQVRVYMKEVADTTLPSSMTISTLADGAILVYDSNGPENVTANSWHTITLQSPFSYSGLGSLYIYFEGEGCTSSGGCSVNMFGASGANKAWNKCWDTSSPDLTTPIARTNDHRVNIRIVFSPISDDYCYPVSGITISDILTDEAAISWTSDNNNFEVQCKLQSETWDSENVITEITSSTSVTLSGLLPSSYYNVRIKSICPVNESSWMSGSFVTGCDVISTFPWVETFDNAWDYNPMTDTAFHPAPLCWLNMSAKASNSTYIAKQSASDAYLYGYSSSTSTNETYRNSEWLMTPVLELSGNETLTFFTKKSSSSYSPELRIYAFELSDGDVTSLADTSAFFLLDSITTFATTYEEKEISLEELSGQYRLAFVRNRKIAQGAIYVNDVTVMPTPTCSRPSGLTASNITGSSVDLTWTESEEATSYNIYYKTSSASTWNIVEATENPFTLTGLEQTTAYTINIKAICSDGNETGFQFAPAVSITTICANLEPPFVEDFDPYPAGTAVTYCWREAKGTWDSIANGAVMWGNTSDWTTSSSYVFDLHAKINSYGSSKRDWLISPNIDLGDGSTAYDLTFDIAYTDFGNANPVEQYGQQKFGVVVSTDGGNTWDFNNAILWKANPTEGTIERNIEELTNTPQRLNINLTELGYTGLIKVAFYAECLVSGGDNDVHIDNFQVREHVDCADLLSFNCEVATSESVNISWPVDEDLEYDLILSYNEGETYDEETATVVNIPYDTELPYVLEGLTSGSTYTFVLAYDCGGESSEPVTISLPSAAETIPFICDFEDEDMNSRWMINNGTHASKLYIGSTSTEEVNNKLYVSSDNGATVSYNTSGTNFVTASIPVEFSDETAGNYKITFEYQGGGESTYDFIKFALLDLSEDLSASTTTPTWASSTAQQEGFIYQSGVKFNLQTIPTTAEIIVPSSLVAGSIKNLVFAWRQDSGSGDGLGVEVDNISIEYLECAPPTDVIVPEGGLQANSITFDLETESGDEWEIQYMPYGAETWESLIVSSSTGIEIDDLMSGTMYKFRVRSICGEDTTWWAPANNNGYVLYQTLCEDITISEEEPFVETFDAPTWFRSGNITTDNDFAPSCWFNIDAKHASYNWRHVTTASYNYNSSAGSLAMYSSTSFSSDTLSDWFITPIFNLNGTETFSFFAKAGTANETLKIMYYNVDEYEDMVSRDDTVNFELLSTIEIPANGDYVPYDILLSELSGRYRLAFYANVPGNYIRIDEVSVHIVDCPRPETDVINVSNVTPTSAVVNIEDENNSAWTIYYKTETETVYSELATTDFYNELTDLLPNTVYEFYVVADCGDSESAPTSVMSFATPCAYVTELPYTQDFEAGWVTEGLSNVAAPSCWININGGYNSTTYVWKQYTTASSVYAGLASAQSYGYSSATMNTYVNNDFLITPAIDVEGGARLRFYAKKGSTSYNGKLKIKYYDVTESGDMTSAADTANFIDLVEISNFTTTYEEYIFDIPELPSTYRIAFARQDTSNGYIYIDNVSIDYVPSCIRPEHTSVVASDITTNTAVISWTDNDESHSSWNVYYRMLGTEEYLFVQATEQSIELTDLLPAVSYEVYVTTNCGNEESEATSVTTFITLQEPTEIPYSTTFDDVESGEWLLKNGNLTNKWHIGVPTGAEGGELFISNDGVNSSYTIASSAGIVIAEKLFLLGASDSIRISFDLTVGGESTSDYLKVFWLPADTVFDATNSTTYYPAQTAYATGVLKMNPNDPTYNYVNLLSGTQRLSITIPNSQNQLKKLVFLWKNDGSLGTQPGAIIDNFEIEEVGDIITCFRPVDNSLTATNITTNSATISWDASDDSQTSWVVYYKGASEETYTSVPATETSIELTGLIPSSMYSVYVTTNCGNEESLPSTILSFSTECGVIPAPWGEEFSADVLASGCWNEATGLLTSNVTFTSTTSASWNYNTTSAIGGVTSGLYKANIWGTSKKEWIITPQIDLGDGSELYQVSLDVAVTDYNNPSTPPDAAADDKFAIVVSTDGGTTWSNANALIWADGDSDTEHNYSSFTNTFTRVTYVLQDAEGNPYTGIVKIGIYGESTASNGDNDLFVDNLSIELAEGGQGGTDPEPEPCDAPTALAASNITETTADITWTGTATSYEVRLNGGVAESVSGTTKQYTGLTANTAYTVEVRAVCEDQTSDWVSVQFTTLEEEVVVVTPPTVSTLAATNITHESAVLNGTITAGSEEITAQGFMYKATTAADWTTVAATGANITATVTSLTSATEYAFKAFATTASGTVEGETMTFTTTCGTVTSFPYVESFEGLDFACWTVSAVTAGAEPWELDDEPVYGEDIVLSPVYGNQAAVHTYIFEESSRLASPILDLSSLTNPYLKLSYARLSFEGPAETLTVQYRTTADGTWTTLTTLSGTPDQWILDSIALPTPSATYQIAFTSEGVNGYGVAVDYLTVYNAIAGEEPEVIAPTVATLAATAITHESATLNGTITAGSETITAQGFMYKATAAADWTTVNATGTTITATLTALTAETEYTFKAFATTATGTVEGTAMTFTTTAAPVVVTPPTVATLAATAITHESATLNGTITAGSETITAQGFMYKATAAADWTTVNATGTTITATLTALTAETEYTFKAFATTASGTVEGTAMTFTTTAAPIVAPVVTTLAATAVDHESATLNGTITAGSETITAQGFMYKATAAADWTTVNATGTTISATLSALTAETEYTFKAFATTATGTVEGTAMTFTTTAAPVVVTPPTVVTLPASTLTHSSAVLNGTVTAGSEAITAQGFMYKPTAASDWTTVAATGENMTLTVEGLEAEMAYDFKAFATTASGTVEGEVMSFITLSGLNDATANAINAMIYPNPADDKATISVSGIAAGAKIVVSDMQGRIIMSDDMIEANYDLNVSNYAAGVYYIRIISGNTVSTQKLIVK